MAKFVRFVVLSLLPLASYGQFPRVSTNCTDASSRSVSWEIHNFTFDTATRFSYGPGTAGRASFSIKNTANGYAFDCLQGDGANTGRVPNHILQGGKVWYSCNVYCNGARDQPDEANPPLDTSFSFDVANKSLSIRQLWSCGNTNYTGTGASVISNVTCHRIPNARPDEVACAPVDVTIKASAVTTGSSQSSIVEDPDSSGGTPNNPFLVPPATKPGVQHNTPGCSKKSQSPSWNVSNFFYSPQGVTFTLKNNALDYVQGCSMFEVSSSIETRLQSQTLWNCTRPDPLHANYPLNRVYTSILWGGPTNVLGMNETWYCDDEDADKPWVYLCCRSSTKTRND